MDKLLEPLTELLRINKQRNEWNNWLDDEATWKFIHALYSKSELFKGIFDYELAVDILVRLFNEFRFEEMENVDEETLLNFLELLHKNLEINVKDYWIVFPLLGAELSNYIKVTEGIHLLAGSRKDKIDKIANIIGLDQQLCYSRFEHTEKSRSPYFFNSPILLVKVTHQYTFVRENAEVIAYYAINMLTILYWAHIHPNYKKRKKFEGFLERMQNNEEEEVEENNHVVIQSTNAINWGHIPIHFQHRCDYNLDWLNTPKLQMDFRDLVGLLFLDPNELRERFLRGIRFFVRGVNLSISDRFFDNDSDMILYLNIAAESILLKNQGEKNKTRKVVGRLAKLGKPEEIEVERCRGIIDSMCRVRGGYVHEGIFQYPNSYDESDESQEINIYKKITARLLSDAFKHVMKFTELSKTKNTNIENLWFESFSDLN